MLAGMKNAGLDVTLSRHFDGGVLEDEADGRERRQGIQVTPGITYFESQVFVLL
jgi:hypothetical protein